MPRLTAVATLSPALFQSSSTNSPGKREVFFLVRGTTKTSSEMCGAELSSLRSQLECWNNGTMEYWVLENCGSGLLAKPY
jgi:hypothetical protein